MSFSSCSFFRCSCSSLCLAAAAINKVLEADLEVVVVVVAVVEEEEEEEDDDDDDELFPDFSFRCLFFRFVVVIVFDEDEISILLLEALAVTRGGGGGGGVGDKLPDRILPDDNPGGAGKIGIPILLNGEEGSRLPGGGDCKELSEPPPFRILAS